MTYFLSEENSNLVNLVNEVLIVIILLYNRWLVKDRVAVSQILEVPTDLVLDALLTMLKTGPSGSQLPGWMLKENEEKTTFDINPKRLPFLGHSVFLWKRK